MKKILTTLLALTVGTLLTHAQAKISIGVTTVQYLIETNASLGYIPGVSVPTTGLATARTLPTVNSYFYEVLTTLVGANPSGGAPTAVPSASPFSGEWLDTSVGGKNNPLTRGGIISLANITSAAGTWAGPTANTYATGTVQWFLIVGWSANLGNNWADASAAVQNPGALSPGANYFFGQSPLAYQAGGGGPDSLPTVNLWGNGTSIPGAGLSAGFTLVLVPEPSNFALAGLGALGMLIARRKK